MGADDDLWLTFDFQMIHFIPIASAQGNTDS